MMNHNPQEFVDLQAKSFEATKAEWRKFCSYYRYYPDKFIDLIRPADCKIDLYFYQRVMLRTLFRHRKVFFTFTRGTAKSFTQILALYLKCVMFAGVNLFICAPTKMQASGISQANIEAIWNFFPLLQNEVKKVVFQSDYTKLIFHNGSKLDVIQVSSSTRGIRKHGGSIEEIVDENMKKDILNEAVIPTMANDRIAACGGVDPNENHKFQWYITTSGTKQSFAYEKLMEVVGEMAVGKNSVSMGAGYELACMHGQLDIHFINDLRDQATFNPLSFAREYESVWTGTSDNSLVSLEDLNACRTLTTPEEKAVDKDSEYVLSYDVARSEGNSAASCALAVIKIKEKPDGTYSKSLVAIHGFDGTHFNEQAKYIKKMAVKYRARVVIVDSNGLGVGLIDQLVTDNVDDNPPWSVTNDDRYLKYKTESSIPMLYAMKSQSKEMRSSDIHNVFMNVIANHKLKILHSESHARASFEKSRKSAEQIASELRPYIMTDLLVEEIMNLEYKVSGNNTQVKQISKSINKDKFSALEYGLFWIHLQEKANQTRRKEQFDVSNFMLVKPAKWKV